MNIAYVRVSTVDQNEERQLDGLKKYGIDEWFIEKVSGKDTNRPKLQEVIKFARKGDTVYVHSLDRLARSTKDLLDIVEQFKAKNVHLVSSKESIDTSTASGKLMLTMIGAIAEFERANMLERQREGIAIAKTKGVYKGRKEIAYPANWVDVYAQYKQRSMTGTKAMQVLKLKHTTFYKLLRQYEQGI
jgi:DNA invertase Pin-like site-specific DNA recombinase